MTSIDESCCLQGDCESSPNLSTLTIKSKLLRTSVLGISRYKFAQILGITEKTLLVFETNNTPDRSFSTMAFRLYALSSILAQSQSFCKSKANEKAATDLRDICLQLLVSEGMLNIRPYVEPNCLRNSTVLQDSTNKVF